MPVILDTDLLTILQSGSQPACDNARRRLDRVPDTEVFTTIVSFQEQMRGWLSVLNQARTEKRLLSAYAELHAMLDDFCRLQVLPFDEDAQRIFAELRRQRIRIGTMDLRIAAIARSLDFTVISRNTRHFGQVPGLRVEDWTR
jgi:tRNA(fMet)-specific endonuclease VapC